MNALAKAAVTGVLASFLFGCAAFTVQSEVAGEHVVNGNDIALGARGVRESLAGGGEATKFFITLTRRSGAAPCHGPDSIIILDGTGRTMPLISPADYVALVQGETSQEAIQRGAAAQYAVSAQQLPTYTSGTLQHQGGGWYRHQSTTRAGGGFAGGLASGLQGLPAVMAANRSAEIEKQIRNEALDALQPQTILPNAYIAGRVWTVAGETPFAVNVMACNEHLELVLDGDRSTGFVHATYGQTEPRPGDPDEDAAVFSAIAANPDLQRWMHEDPERWDLAVTFDQTLRSQERYADVCLEERFADVVRMIKQALPETVE